MQTHQELLIIILIINLKFILSRNKVIDLFLGFISKVEKHLTFCVILQPGFESNRQKCIENTQSNSREIKV